MSLTTRVVGGLALGLAAGAAINASRQLTLLTLASWIEPVGALWVNAILMTVIPLVVSSLILGVASRDDPRLIVQLGSASSNSPTHSSRLLASGKSGRRSR
jgi:Na+/H+-dicarboxylate symporter